MTETRLPDPDESERHMEVTPEYRAGFARAMAEAERVVRGWPTSACGDEYMTDGRSNYWDAGNDYDQSREDAGSNLRFYASERLSGLAAAAKRLDGYLVDKP